jgi:hypothetical protein
MTAVYPVALEALLRGELDLLSDTLKLSIFGAGYTYNPNHRTIDDLHEFGNVGSGMGCTIPPENRDLTVEGDTLVLRLSGVYSAWAYMTNSPTSIILHRDNPNDPEWELYPEGYYPIAYSDEVDGLPYPTDTGYSTKTIDLDAHEFKLVFRNPTTPPPQSVVVAPLPAGSELDLPLVVGDA